MSETNVWVVLETGQMGAWPNEVVGPFSSSEDAHNYATYRRRKSRDVGRFDRFEVGYVVTDDSPDMAMEDR